VSVAPLALTLKNSTENDALGAAQARGTGAAASASAKALGTSNLEIDRADDHVYTNTIDGMLLI
jgi:hypothetical protein